MKKIISVIFATALTISAFASDIFAGKLFNENGQDFQYKFNNDKTINLMSSEKTNAIFDYELSEKEKTITFKVKKLPSFAFGFLDESTLIEKKDFLKIINDKNFFQNSMNKTFEKQSGINPEIDFSKTTAIDETINFVCFIQYHFAKETECKDYSKTTDYVSMLKDVVLEKKFLPNEEEFNKTVLKQLREEIEFNIKNSEKSKLILTKTIELAFSSATTFKYEKIDEENFSLKEISEKVPIKTIFNAIRNQTKSFGIENGLLIDISKSNGDLKNAPIYDSKDELKKDSGKITFVNIENPKDKIKANYSVKRNKENISITVKLPNKDELTGEYKLDEKLLVLEK